VAKPRPQKKREPQAANGQLPLPTPRAPVSANVTRVLPMDLKVGDRLVDETGEWEVVSRPVERGEERRHPRQEGRPARDHRGTNLGRARARQRAAILTVLSDLEEFFTDHRLHGALTGDATEPAWNGYLVTVGCPCGVVFARWVTPEDADADLARIARLN
jgi:hypothetical protein